MQPELSRLNRKLLAAFQLFRGCHDLTGTGTKVQ
jgi:hypothetical protein